MKSTLVNMVAVLFTITLVASAGVGYVNMITVGPIAEAKAAATQSALRAVLPSFDRTETTELTLDELPVAVHTARSGEAVVGYAVETASKNGFSGMIRMVVGFDATGRVLNVNVLEQNETPGLGTKMADEGNPLFASFEGRNPGEMKLAVKKDGGDVDALTAATISSRAYVDAMARAYAAYKQIAEGVAPAASDTASGATATMLRPRPIRLRVRPHKRAITLRKEEIMNKLQLILKGIVKENPTFVLVLGMCPTLGTTTSAANGFGMGVATMAVLILSNIVISLIKNFIPDKVRIPAFIVVIASFVTIVQMLMQAFVPALYATLGVFIPLIVVNCIILGRAEAFASKNNAFDSALDGLGIGLGFTLSLTVIGTIRELLGSGAVFGYSLGTADYMPLVFVLAPGGFLVLGYLMVVFNKLAKK